VGWSKQAAVIDGYISDATAGLAVHPQSPAETAWNVTHIASGRTVARDLKTLRAAQEAALRLAPLGDWTRGMQEILDDTEMRERAENTRNAIEAGF
jgi:hypothetical protein